MDAAGVLVTVADSKGETIHTSEPSAVVDGSEGKVLVICISELVNPSAESLDIPELVKPIAVFGTPELDEAMAVFGTQNWRLCLAPQNW